MNQRPLLVTLGITVVLAGLVGAWFLFDTSSPEDDTARANVRPGSEGSEEVATPGAPEGGAEALAPVTAAPSPNTAPDAERRREVEAEPADLPEETVVIQGHARFAEGTPGDERAYALAVRAPLRAPRIYREGGPADAAWNPEVESEDLVDASEVAPDGSFRLRVPSGSDEVHLLLTGRYTFSRTTTTQRLDDEQHEITGELGAWVTGRLVPPHAGADPASVELSLGPDVAGGFDAFNIARQFWEVQGKSGADGSFELRGVPGGHDYAIRLKPEAFAALIERPLAPEAGQHVEHDITMADGGTLRGRVVDEDGDAVAGADIEAFLPGLTGRILEEVREGETDAEGRFALPHVPAGRIDLQIRHEEYEDLRFKVPKSLEDGGEVADIVITLKRGLSITGRVRYPDGTPAANATVSASLAREAGNFGSFRNRVSPATTDEQGSFAIRGLEEEAYQLKARLDGEPDDDRPGGWRAEADDVAAGSEGVALTLEALTALRGVVTDLDGRPIDEFQVFCTKKGTGGQFGIGAETRNQPVSDEQGRFEVEGLGSGIWEVRVVAKGFARSETQETLLPQSSGDELDFALERGSAILGRVLDVGGNPVVGARVSIALDLQAQLASIGGNSPPDAFSDAEGQFELEGLDPGSVTVVAVFEGFAKSEGVTVDVLPGEVVEGVELQLRVGGTLTGEVFDDKGEPAEGRMVIVQKTPSYDAQHILTTDADGAFRVEHLEPGSWQVVSMTNFEDVIDASANPDGEQAAGFMNDMKLDIVDITDGAAVHVVLGAPPEDPVKILGRLVHGGEPVKGSAVSFMPEQSKGLSDLKITTTSSEGAFEVTLDHPGEYLITVQNNVGGGQQNSVEFRETVPEKPEHRLTLELPLGKIVGTVYGPDGKPLGGCRITLNTEGGIQYGSFLGGHYTEAQTKGDGTYAIEFLDAGSYTVSAGGEVLGGLFGSGASGGRAIRGGVRVREGETVSGLDFHLSEPGELTVSVIGAGGEPIRGAAVFVRDDQGRLLERFSMVATDATGRFTYTGLAAGSYSVSARLGDQVSEESLLVSIPEGGATDVQVSLGAGTVLRVTVTDDADEEIAAIVSVLDENGHEMSGMYTLEEIMQSYQRGFSSKEQRIGPLPPGTYQVVAMTDDGRTTSKPVTVRGTEDRRVKLRLK